jgi:hypothetical protein
VGVVQSDSVWTGGGTTNDEIDATEATNMVHTGLTQLTGAASVTLAMQALVPSTPAYNQAKVALKINHISSYLSTHYAVIKPIYDALVDIGIQPGNITAYDTRSLKSSAGPISGNIQFEQYNQGGSDDANWGGSASISGRTVRWPRTLYEADWLINLAVYKDHSGPAVTLCCKNHLGSINKSAAGFPCAGAELAPLNAHAQLSPHWISGMGGKTVLCVIDAIFGSISGNGPGNPVDCAPERLYLSCDPINIDHVGWTDMGSLDGEAQSEPPHLAPAVTAGVGVRDTDRVVRTTTDGPGPAATRDDVDRAVRDRRGGSGTDDDVKDRIRSYRSGE